MVLVGFSGGVDSALLLKVARDALGRDNVLAVMALSETTPAHERRDAFWLAERLDVELLSVEGQEMGDPDFLENSPERCYICKKIRFGALLQIARERDLGYVLVGENIDDHKDFRPGIRASRELGVRSPLSEAGFSKEEIRRLSKDLGLPTWRKPSYACLASRIPFDSPITAEKLRQVDSAEEYIRELLSQAQVRVRHHGGIARIEVEPFRFETIIQENNRERIDSHLKDLGFKFVVLDLEGYRTGSLNPENSPA
jgi:uncharacterized protein